MKRTPLTLRPTPEQLRSGSTLRRSPIQRNPESPPLQRQVINRVSDKRKAANATRRKVLAQMRQEDPWCARCRVVPWTDGNELLRRSAGGSITDRNNIVGLCRPCHIYITEHPRYALENGWQISRFSNG